VTYNAANRKHIRAAEKALLPVAAIDREVISGLMSIANGRHWVFDRLADAQVFSDPFNPDPNVHAYLAGQRSMGIRMFNEIILYAPQNFIKMLEEAHERNAIADAIRGRADAEPDSGTDTDPESDAAA
jgi:hypothetical protein